MKHLFAIALLAAAGIAQAACTPPIDPNTLKPRIATSENGKGCWAGWWCERPGGYGLYIVAAKKSYCNAVGRRQAVMAWIAQPGWDVDALTFGQDPHTDPEMLNIWVRERFLVDRLRPQE